MGEDEMGKKEFTGVVVNYRGEVIGKIISVAIVPTPVLPDDIPTFEWQEGQLVRVAGKEK